MVGIVLSQFGQLVLTGLQSIIRLAPVFVAVTEVEQLNASVRRISLKETWTCGACDLYLSLSCEHRVRPRGWIWYMMHG